LIASQQGHASVCDVLLSHGAEVNQANNNGATPLFIASQNGHASVCDLLLGHGAEVNQANNDGATPLWIASQNGHASVCDLLLARYHASPLIPLLNLPNDLILLILEHLSLNELLLFQRYSFSLSRSQQQLHSSSSSSSYSHDPILSNLLRLFNHCGGRLFHRFQLSPRYLNWLSIISVRVTSLKLEDFDDQSLEYLMTHKDSVHELDFSSSRKLTDQSLTQIGRCPCLTFLSLTHCSKITDFGLLKFLKSNPQLERLDLSLTSHLTGQIIAHLGECCLNLQHLDVSRNSWFDRSSLMLLVEPLPRLRSLDISHSPIPTPSMIDFLKAKPEIQSIRYDAAPLTMTLGDDGGRHLLMQLALRSIASSITDSQRIGFHNLLLLLQWNDGSLYKMIRSTGALKHIVQCLSHPVGVSPLSSSAHPHLF
jgi:hypothetical protein